MNLNIDVFSIQSKNGGTTSHSYPAMIVIVSPAMIVGKRRQYEMLGVKPAKWRYTIIYIYMYTGCTRAMLYYVVPQAGREGHLVERSSANAAMVNRDSID